MTIEAKVLEIIEGKRSAPITKALLRVMSGVYGAGATLHHLAYDHLLPQTKLSVPVVSIGNIVAGGTGKTPFVHYLADRLSKEFQVAILSRGYGRKGKKTILVRPETDPADCGDEPYLLAKKLPQAKVIVDANRAFSGHLASVLGAELVLLDDGMQYLPLKKDLQIVLMNEKDLFGKGYYLPRGLLRDSPKRLKKAHLIVMTGVSEREDYEKGIQAIRKYSEAPVMGMDLIVKNNTQLASKRVAAFCGIASPSRFQMTLQRLGCDVLEKIEKPDHAPFSIDELERLSNRAQSKGAQALVCTEKDWVKIPKDFHPSLPIIPVEIAYLPTFGEEKLDQIIQKISEVPDEQAT